jgi:hypothetical protein
MSSTKDGTYDKIKGIDNPTKVTMDLTTSKYKVSGPIYYIKICAYSSIGSGSDFIGGEFSDIFYVKTYTNAPVITSVTRDADQNAIVSWNSIPEADAYQVWRSSTADGTYEQVGVDVSQTDSFKDTTATPTGTWFYKIRLVEKMGKNADVNNPDKISLYGDYSAAVQLPAALVPTTNTGTEVPKNPAANVTEQPTGQPTESSTKNSAKSTTGKSTERATENSTDKIITGETEKVKSAT